MGKAKDYLRDAELLYLSGYTLFEISNVMPVSVTTLSEWKNKYSWGEKRKTLGRNPAEMAAKINGLMADLVDQIVEAKARGEDTTALGDELSKYNKVKEGLVRTEDHPAAVVKVTADLSRFMVGRLNDRERAKFMELLTSYYEKIKRENYG